MLGKKLSPILQEIESMLWEHEATLNTPLELDDETFRASTKIFMSALMDKMWISQEKSGMLMKDRCSQAEFVGLEVREIIKRATGIDMVELHKNYKIK